jgi:hypothetical protein
MQLTSFFRSSFIAKFNFSPFFNQWAKDYLVTIFFFVLGGSIALIFYRKIGYTHFYQNFIPEAVLWACGRDFAFPKEVINELIPFLSGKERVFDCAKLATIELNTEPGAFISAQPYLTWCVAILWKLFGVSYAAISPLVFILFGLYGSGIYLLLRQFLNRFQSILASMFLCCSPIVVYMLPNLRDFSKAPFIIWTLLLLISAIKTSTQHNKKSTWLAISAGFTVALGLGFRADLFIFFPIGIIFLLIGISNSAEKSYLKLALLKSKVIIPYICTFLIIAYPTLKNGGISGVGGMFVMQGMTQPFHKALKLGDSGYLNGLAYSDEFTLSSIASQERENITNWDELELLGVRGFSATRAMTVSTANLVKWADLFIADFSTKALKSFAWIIGYPVFIKNSELEFTNPFFNSNPESIIFLIYKSIGYPVLLIFNFIGLYLLIFKAFLQSRNYGFAVSFLLIFLCTYPAIQFNLRHFFYLEFIWIICFLSFFSLPPMLMKHKKEMLRSIFYIFGIITVITAIYFLLIQYQSWKLSDEIKKLMLSSKEGVELIVNREDDDKIYYKLPVPNKFKAIINAPYDSMTNKIEYQGPQWDVRSAAQRYLLSIGGKDCNAKDIDIYLIYKKTNATWQPLDTKLVIAKHDSEENESLLFSGFYRPTQFLDEIAVPINLKDCNFILQKIEEEVRLPFAFSARISQSKISGALYNNFGYFMKKIPN